MGEPSLGGWKPIDARDIEPGAVIDGGCWKVTSYRVQHGDGLGFPPAFLQRWLCYGYRFEAEGKVVAISGDTVDCDGLAQLAQNADVLVHCCYMASAEIENEHFRRVVQHTLAAGDTVGKIAARANAKTLVLTHHRPRRDDRYLQVLADEVARDFSGRIIVGQDLTEVEV
jgi:ribonuclease Z